MTKTALKKILLAQVTEVRSDRARNVGVVVDDETHLCLLCNRHNQFGKGANLVDGRLFCPKLNEIGTSLTKLARHFLRFSPFEVGRVNERVKQAFRKWFHHLSPQETTDEHG